MLVILTRPEIPAEPIRRRMRVANNSENEVDIGPGCWRDEHHQGSRSFSAPAEQVGRAHHRLDDGK